MTQPPPGTRPPSDAEARTRLAWRVAPLSLGFFLDLVDIGRHRDVLDSLLFGAILIANTEPLSQDPGLALHYGDVHELLPDEIRRPVSINALAHSLRLPFETTRRRVGRMIRAGDVVATPRGVYVPTAAVMNTHFLALVMRRHERLRQFYADLLAIDALPQLGSDVLPPAAASPLRLTNRAVAEYMLRIADPMIGLVGDPAAALILLQMTRENTEGLAHDGLAAWPRDPAASARPVRIAALAARLRFSPETTRRHAIALEARGFCARLEAGLVATAPSHSRATVAQLAENNLVNVQRLFARLRQLGALAPWDAAASSRAPALRRS